MGVADQSRLDSQEDIEAAWNSGECKPEKLDKNKRQRLLSSPYHLSSVAFSKTLPFILQKPENLLWIIYKGITDESRAIHPEKSTYIHIYGFSKLGLLICQSLTFLNKSSLQMFVLNWFQREKFIQRNVRRRDINGLCECAALVFPLDRRRILPGNIGRVVGCHPSVFQLKDLPCVFGVV